MSQEEEEEEGRSNVPQCTNVVIASVGQQFHVFVKRKVGVYRDSKGIDFSRNWDYGSGDVHRI